MRKKRAAKTGYPSDVSDEEWAFVAPYLTLMTEEAPQRVYPVRAVFNGLRYIVRAGCSWRMLPNDLPPWALVYQQTQRWLKAGVFETMVHDLRAILRLGEGRDAAPRAAIFDSRTLQSTPESGARGGWDGAKRKKGAKVHMAVDTLGHLLASHVTPANAQDRAQVSQMAQTVQEVTGESVETAYVDQGYTGAKPQQAAQAHGIELMVVKLPQAKKGYDRLVEATKKYGPTNLNRFKQGVSLTEQPSSESVRLATLVRAGFQRRWNVNLRFATRSGKAIVER